MEAFLYSLNCTMPVFLMMVLGYVLFHKKMLTQNFVDVCDTLVFNVTLPIMLFRDMASMDLQRDFDVKFVLYCAVASLIGIALAWILARLFIKDRSIIAEWVQGSYRGSIAVLGGAFLLNIYPEDGAAHVVAQALLGSVIIFNIMAVLILALERPNGSKQKDDLPAQLKKASKSILSNPLIISILLGGLSALLGFTYPTIIDKTMSSIASLTSPLALLAVGAEFKWGKMQENFLPLLGACAYKLLIQPALFLPVAALLGWRNEWLVTLMIMMGAPTTPSSFIMARNMGHDGAMTANIIAGTTLFSAATVTFWLWLGRITGLVI
ncbi:MAG: AEC family transporter [Oscillospiraceae bacterium]|nr:AEC family transporter [Oscillospiraceae bacterium]